MTTGHLFDDPSDATPIPDVEPDAPLADRMRPRTPSEVEGQDRLLGEGKLLRRILEEGDPPSIIFWGPPGTGKTTLARLIAQASDAAFVELSATLSGVQDVRDTAAAARQRRGSGRRTILFIDEIHRFNKAQQDAFLPHVERGDIVLIGATTENPSFEVVAPLLSRCKVLTLRPLDEEDLVEVLERALREERPRGLGGEGLEAPTGILEAIAAFADGDARVALGTLELAARFARRHAGSDAPVAIDEDAVREAMQSRTLRYDKTGDQHFDQISALHKSVRNGDPDAALYWLARMLEAGEDPLYVARRLVRMASEDIGLADPQALPLAVAGFQAVHAVGMPEGALALAQVAVHLATAPKSNSVYRAYGAAKRDVEESGALSVPLHLRNAPTRLMEELGHGRDYEYAHDLPEGVADMTCLPEELAGRRYFRPGERGREPEIAARLQEWREARRRARRRRQEEGRSEAEERRPEDGGSDAGTGPEQPDH